MKIMLNKLHFPITALGYGKRIGVWMQGCSIRCAGCVSRDTWTTSAEYATTIADLRQAMLPWFTVTDGVTISGGEPFDQPEPLASLIDLIRKNCTGDVLVYSGYSHEHLQRSHRKILNRIDVLITEPYDLHSGQMLALRGSDNQKIFLLTDLARRRYPLDINEQRWNDTRRMDLVVEGEMAWLVGIPKPGDMQRLRSKLEEMGYNSNGSDQSPSGLRT